MSIENLKRWHWALIGLGLGLLVAWTQISVGVDGVFSAGEHKTIGQQAFEDGLRKAAVRERPVIDRLNVYPDGKRFVLKMRRLEKDPRFSDDGRRWRYVNYSLVTAVPYIPAIDRKETVDVSILPASAKVRVNLAADSQGSPVTFTGWLPAGGHSRDPGSGAQVSLHLRPADYRLTVVADASQRADAIDQLIISVNGRQLAPLVPDPAAGPSRWRTEIAREAFSAESEQTLKFSRQTEPLAIREIHLLDPKYSVLEYLQRAAPGDKPATYRFGWWLRPRATLAISTIAAVVLVGGLWPTVLSLLVGAGFGRPPRQESNYDLNRFKGESEKTKAVMPATPTEDELTSMRELEERLMAGLPDGSPQRTSLADEQRAAATPAPRELKSRSIEAMPTAGPAKPEPDPTYGGEYYPVVRPTGEKKDQ